MPVIDDYCVTQDDFAAFSRSLAERQRCVFDISSITACPATSRVTMARCTMIAFKAGYLTPDPEMSGWWFERLRPPYNATLHKPDGLKRICMYLDSDISYKYP